MSSFHDKDRFFSNSLFKELVPSAGYNANHAVRYHKNRRLKKNVSTSKRDIRYLLKYYKQKEEYFFATRLVELYNGRRFRRIRTIKNYCPFSGRIRSLVKHLKVSKFVARDFAKSGAILGLTKH